jgi:hypothetical protein
MLLADAAATVTLLTIDEIPKDVIDKVEFLRFTIKVDLSLFRSPVFNSSLAQN